MGVNGSGDAHRITNAMQGDWYGDYGLVPGPGHSIKDRSVSVRDGEHGIIVHSFAGDDWREIKDCLRARGLIDDAFNVKNGAPKACRETKHYVYQSPNGAPLMRVVRKPGKKFHQERFDNGRWIPGVRDVKIAPYKLPRILASSDETIFVVEGEKDVDRLTSLGYVATTNPGGAKKWPDHFAAYFENRDVIVLPDNDDVGKEHAEMVRESLSGTACSVEVVELPGLPEKGDVTDWLDAGNDPTALFDVIQEHGGGNKSELKGGPLANVFTLSDLDQQEFEPIAWTVPELIPQGLTILVGKPKVGKSWFVLQLAMAVSEGAEFLDFGQCEKGEALYLALEDGKQRLQNRTRTVLGSEVHGSPDSLHFGIDWPKLGEGCEDSIRAFAKSHPDLRLVVIDVFARVWPEETDGMSYRADYNTVRLLQELAQELGIAIVLVHHSRKKEADDPLDLISGTSGLTGAADATFVLAPNRSNGYVSLYGRGREILDVEVALEFEGGRYRSLGNVNEVTRSASRRKIIEFLREVDLPQGPKVISDGTGLGEDAVRKLVLTMVRDGDLVKLGRGEYAVPSVPEEAHITHDGHTSIPMDV